MTPLVIAHRGASWDAPENTIEAFELAIAQGADYVEFDVRPTPRGTLVCAHDPVRGELPVGTPTLDETLETLRGRVGLAVEIKHHATTSRTLQALEHHAIKPDETIIVSFHRRAIEKTGALRPDLRTIQHVQRVPLRWAAQNAWGAGFWDPRATRGRIERAQKLGLATAVYTVNEPDRMRELAARGVTGIFSDRPALLREILQNG